MARRVVIVGAGVIGLMCARELVRRGLAVTIADPGEPGQGSSGNTGLITPSFCGPLPAPGLIRTSLRWLLRRDSPLSIRPQSLPGLAGWLWRFARHCNETDYRAGLRAVAELTRPTMNLFDELAADGLDFEMHQQGLLFAFEGRAAMARALVDLEALHDLGYGRPMTLAAGDLREREPALSPDLAGGIFVEGERSVRSDQLTAALVERLHNQGAEFLRLPIDGFVRHGRAVRAAVAADGRTLEGDFFIVAAGAGSGRVTRALGYRLPVQAGTGYSITVERPCLCLRGPLYLEEAKIACSPFDDVLRLAGTLELAGLRPRFNRQRLSALRAALDRLIPGWDRGERISYWSAMRPVTPDGLPVIGLLPRCDNACVATGHGMLGVTLAPVTARAVADLTCAGRTDVDLAAFAPDRFTRPVRLKAQSNR